MTQDDAVVAALRSQPIYKGWGAELRTRIVGLGVGATVLLMLALSPQAASAEDLETTCAAIEEIAEGDPAEALELIDRLRSPATAYVSADKPLPAEFGPLAVACESERLSAIAADAAKRLEAKSASEITAAGWSAFVDRWIAPFASMALTVALCVAGLAIASRFASLLPGVRRGLRRGPFRVLAAVTGTTLILVASVGIAIAIALPGVEDVLLVSSAEWIAIGVCVAAAAVGVLVLALALASRLKIALEVRAVDGKRDELASARAAGVLSEMGGSPAQGVYKPEGSDIEALSNAIPEVSGMNWSGVVKSVARFLFLGTPWRVIVDTDLERFAVVSIFHNGAQAAVQRIDLALVSTTDDPVRTIDAYTAAIVVTTLARYRDGFEGLSGATNWVGVAQYFLASRFDEGDPSFVRLARSAVQKDPRNYVARFALQSVSDTSDAEYAEWLRRELKGIQALPRGRQPLEVELRARRSLGVTEINLHSDGELTEPDAIEEMATNVLELARELRKSEARQTILHQLLRSDTAILIRDLQKIVSDGRMSKRLGAEAARSKRWFDEAQASQYPDVAYNLACHYALLGDRVGALRHLRIAIVDAELRAQARSDTELASLRSDTEFRALVSDLTRTSFWQIDYFGAYEVKLKECGLRAPGDLGAIENTKDIRAYLRMEKAPFRKLASACHLASRARAATSRVEIESLEVELLAVFFEMGIFAVRDIPETWSEATGEFLSVVDDTCTRHGKELAPADALSWLAVVRQE